MSGSRHMGLGELADVIGPERVVGVPVGEVGSIAYDSRQVSAGTLFFAVPGVHVDGHAFIADAVARGAAGVVAEHETPGLAVPQLVVNAAGSLAWVQRVEGFYSVWRFDRHGRRRLSGGDTTQRIRSLRLRGTRVTWRQAGRLRSASLI